MNKIIFTVLFLIIASAFVFGQNNANNYFQLGGTFMVNSTSAVSIFSGGFNLAGNIFFNNYVGIGGYINLLIGSFYEVSFLITDVLLGPAIRLVNTEQFRLPVALGVYTAGLYTKSVNVFNLGIGANLTGEYRINQRMHLYGRYQFAFGFLGGKEFFNSFSIGIGL